MIQVRDSGGLELSGSSRWVSLGFWIYFEDIADRTYWKIGWKRRVESRRLQGLGLNSWQDGTDLNCGGEFCKRAGLGGKRSHSVWATV